LLRGAVLGAAGLTLGAPQVAAAPGGARLRGIVQTGGGALARPLAGVTVTLFEATASRPRALGQARTDASGRFMIASPVATSPGVFYASAALRAGVEFVAVLGPNLPPAVTINELTTVAACYSMAQFYRDGVISGSPFGLRIAAMMNDNIVTPATGTPSPVLRTSPNADQTNSLRSTRSLANLLAACAAIPRLAAAFCRLTTAPGGAAPGSTAQALANLARNPGQNVEAIYRLTILRVSYRPPLVRVPDAWTVTVKVNDSGSDDILFGGPGNLVFDARGYAWVTNNVDPGKTTSSHAVVALQPNGRPADGANGTPISPIMGGGILGTGFGVTVDPQGSAWFGNFGWGGVDYQPSPTGSGSVSRFTPSGVPVSGPDGYQGGPDRAQGMAADAEGNIWISSFGNDSVYVFPGGDPDLSIGFPQYQGSQPFDVAIAPDGTAWVANSGGFVGQYPSSVARFALVGGVLERQFLRFLGSALKGIAVDSLGNAWVASLGDNRVYGIRPDGTEIGGFGGGGMDGPWGVAVDGEDNLWVSNFGPLGVGTNFTDGRLTKLCGANPATRPPGAKVGDPISPPTGYTTPSAGSQVRLHNGDPLYGPGRPPSFAPMMRQTSAVIDQAGNVWSINNWKPDFDIDLLSNPGGDGIIIFVGLAAPPAPAH
jgi:hypothetical protein